MPSQQGTSNDPATPEEKEKAAEVESYGGVPMDDQELADVWTSGGHVESGAEAQQPGDATAQSEGNGQDAAGSESAGSDGEAAESQRDVAMDAPGGNEPTD